MKPIPEGYRVEHSLVVREDMTVDFEMDEPDLGKLHPVYATYWLTKHFELVSRKIILPFLETHEEGIGFEVSVKHTASALPGMRVDLSATYLGSERGRIYARCEAISELGDPLGEGRTTQVVMARDKLEAAFAGLEQRWQTFNQD